MTNFSLDTLRSSKIVKERNSRARNRAITNFLGNALSGSSAAIVSTAKAGLRALGFVSVKAARFAGFLFGGVLEFTGFTATGIWGIMVESFMFIRSFDWNQRDTEIQKAIARNNQRVLVAAAETLGETLPFGLFFLANLYTGKLIGAAKGIAMPVLSARIGAALADEGLQELRASLQSFFSRSSRALAANTFMSTILTLRENEWLGQQSIDEDRINGSIGARIQRRIDRLPQFLREPTEEFLESFEDGIIEAGYVITFEIDDYVAANRLSSDNEVQRAIDVVIDENRPPIRVIGPQDEVQQTITTTLATKDFLDVEPVIPEGFTLKPGFDRPQLLTTYRFVDDKKTCGTLAIPHYNGPRNPRLPRYTKGDWQGKWILKDGSHLICYASTAREALRVVRELSRYVPAEFKTGNPTALQSTRKIKNRKVEPRKSVFFAEGHKGSKLWTHYANVG